MYCRVSKISPDQTFFEMSMQIFVSYNFDNHATARNVKTFFQQQGGRCQGRPVFVEGDLSLKGDAAIDAAILRVMEPCVAVLFVVGDDDHNSPWIDREAQVALSRNLGVVAVRVPNTSGGLPNRIARLDIPFVSWGQDTLCDALNSAVRTDRRAGA